MIPSLQQGQFGRRIVGVYDADFPNVALLVQGGSDGGTTINDLSSLGGSASITAGAAFSSAQQVFGANMIGATHILPNISGFTSSGAGSRFARPSGQSFTIESYIRFSSIPNTDPSGVVWSWVGPSGHLATLKLYANTGELRFVNGVTQTTVTTLAANTTFFVQTTCAGNTVTVDVDGTEYLSQTMGSDNAGGTYTFRVAATTTANSTSASWWTTPTRFTQNVARARGSVPSAPFPNS